MIEEIIDNFRSISQQNNLSQDIKKPKNRESSLNLAERIKNKNNPTQQFKLDALLGWVEETKPNKSIS